MIMMDQYFIRFPGFRKKTVTLSYDDGVIQDKRIIRLLDANGMKATFNINSGFLLQPSCGKNDRPKFSLEEALEVYGNSSHEVAVHSLTHPFLTQLPPARAAWEILEDRRNLEQYFHRIIRGCAYPMGKYNDDVISVLKNCGIVYARTTESTHGFDLPLDWLRLQPTCHHDDTELKDLCRKFLELDYPYGSKMFYLWGHGYEFDENGNWDVLEQFCETMGGREEIWYATNIEIHDYLDAASRLHVSADGKTLFNPTSSVLFLESHGRNSIIRQGEMLYLK